MAVFRDAEQLYECLGGLFDALARHAEWGPKLRQSATVLRFTFTDPQGSITVDGVSPPADSAAHLTVVRGDGGGAPGPEGAPGPAEVELTMPADVAHRLWLGKLNIMMAVTLRQIVVKGPLSKVMQLLPVVKPASELYPRLLAEKGYGALAEA